jgi:hypothetical protein
MGERCYMPPCDACWRVKVEVLLLAQVICFIATSGANVYGVVVLCGVVSAKTAGVLEPQTIDDSTLSAKR